MVTFLAYIIPATLLAALIAFFAAGVLMKGTSPQKSTGRYSVNLYVPCKDDMPHLENNIRSVLAQKYPDLRVYLIVGEASDSAFPVLTRIAGKALISGKAAGCSQKVHNMSYGIMNSRKADIYAFFDSDIELGEDSVDKLVSALESNRPCIVTSYPRKMQGPQTLAESVFHLYYGFQLAAAKMFKGVWGGYFGMFREDFENLEIEKHWAKSISDDMTVTKRATAHGHKVIFIDNVRLIDNNVHGTLLSAIQWVRRQTFMLKVTISSYWAYTVAASALFFLGSVAVLVIPFIQKSMAYSIATLMLVVELIAMLLILSRAINLRRSLLNDLLFLPPALVLAMYGVLSSLWMSAVSWSGVTYRK